MYTYWIIRCELLQNVYLCISTYNIWVSMWCRKQVVNCFKMCIFALARTTYLISHLSKSCCELLQNVYLCISTYNLKVIFTCITASNKTFVQTKNAKQKGGCVKMSTSSFFYAQSPDFLKPGLCYFLKFLYL